MATANCNMRFSPFLEELESRLSPATFLVNSNDDLPDILEGDGIAADKNGSTTLRAAIMEANKLVRPQE